MKLIKRTSVFWRLVASHGIPARCRASEREHSLLLAIAVLLHSTAYPEAGPTHGRSAMLAPEVGALASFQQPKHLPQHAYRFSLRASTLVSPSPSRLYRRLTKFHCVMAWAGHDRMGKHHQCHPFSAGHLTRTGSEGQPAPRPDQTSP